MNRHNSAVVDDLPADARLGVTVTAPPRAAIGTPVSCTTRVHNATAVQRTAELRVSLEAPDGRRNVLRVAVLTLAAGGTQSFADNWPAVPGLVPRGYRVIAELRGGRTTDQRRGELPPAFRVLHWDGETVSVPAGELKGDLNCDGAVDFLDINPFVLLLTDPGGWAAAYPGCPSGDGDISGDGRVDFLDINPFVALLGT